MMNILEEAIIYATIMHQGKVRKFGNSPFILHPLEVAQILSTMTDDVEVITAGILHDIVEDTDGTLEEIEGRFGKRVADLVSSESEDKYPGQSREDSWKRRKEESLRVLKSSNDIGVKMLWLADKLANVRSMAALYSERGEEFWQDFHQSDPDMQLWYYRTIAETVELSLNKTGAFKELVKHINFIWPGTFDSEKGRYRKYREVSIDGCEMIGRGAKGDVYRYDDELIIKVFNQKNTYHDVEQEIALSRRAFILGVPTAISFGIVSVGERYGAMYELVDSDTVSRLIARSPGQVEQFAAVMAELAHRIHDTSVTDDDDEFPDVSERLRDYIDGGVGREDEMLASKCRRLLDSISGSSHLVHGDFHTNNVFLQNGEPLLIDMDRIAKGHPVAEISDLYYFYVVLGDDDPLVVENFMGFSYHTAKRFFNSFLAHYLGTEDEDSIREVTEKASILSYSRKIRMIRKKGSISEWDGNMIKQYLGKISELTGKYDTLEF
ncbi:MAG: HD domain-containing protein [Lachnospiraceae bacterium]|nr:HD domain-containing protein [Lachnospiraceae bacterium]